MISQGMLVCLLFTLSIGVCLFMYIHQKTSHIENTINKVTTCIHSIQKQLFSNDVDKEERVCSESVPGQGVQNTVVFEQVNVNDESSEYGDENDHEYSNDEDDDDDDDDIDKQEFMESSDISEVQHESDGFNVEEVVETDTVEELDGIKSVHVLDPRVSSKPNFKSFQLSELKQYIKDNEIPLKSLNKYKKAELVSILENFVQSQETEVVNDTVVGNETEHEQPDEHEHEDEQTNENQLVEEPTNEHQPVEEPTESE